jgi:hypothetical protein
LSRAGIRQRIKPSFDLNPVAAGIAVVPEASEHTSIKRRVEHVEAQGRTHDLKEVQKGGVAESAATAGLEDAHWLCPSKDRRRIDSPREGMIEGFSLGRYLLLVDYTGRSFRQGKAMISREVAAVFDRIGTDAETWQARIQKLNGGRLLGRLPDGIGTFSSAASRQRLREVTQRLGLRRAVNLGGCLVT